MPRRAVPSGGAAIQFPGHQLPHEAENRRAQETPCDADNKHQHIYGCQSIAAYKAFKIMRDEYQGYGCCENHKIDLQYYITPVSPVGNMASVQGQNNNRDRLGKANKTDKKRISGKLINLLVHDDIDNLVSERHKNTAQKKNTELPNP